MKHALFISLQTSMLIKYLYSANNLALAYE